MQRIYGLRLLLSVRRIGVGEKLRGVRALERKREVARGAGGERIGRVEEDELAPIS